jgi:transcriptional regulator with XRE-family HTH domain
MSKKDPPGYPGDEAIKQAFGEALRQVREEKGLSLEEAEAIFRREMEKSQPLHVARALGIVVKRLRKQQDLSRAQLSSASGLPLRFIIDVERGKAKDASLTDIVRLCFALSIPPTDFVSQVDEAAQRMKRS